MDYKVPKRIRLLQALRNHLYSRVKETLATDREIRNLHGLNDRIEKAFVTLEKPKKKKVFCGLKCGFEDSFIPDAWGMTYFEAVGTCPVCNAPTVYKDGKPTAVLIEFKSLEQGIK